MQRPTLSFVLPIYNEGEVIAELHRQLQALLADIAVDTEVIFVNDGSRDGSFGMLREIAAHDSRYRIVSFSRNFGHQAAITAGVDFANGEAVVVMDSDLQDPPEVVRAMLDKWREGFDVVYGRRGRRAGETWFKLLTARYFYRLFALMIPIDVPLDTGDFRLMSRRVIIVLRQLREKHRFVRGLVAWVGFKSAEVVYDRPQRFAGETKYPLSKMIRFAIDGITSFSVLPLRFSTYLGLGTIVVSLGVVAWALISKFVFQRVVPGWTGIMIVSAFFAAVQLLMIGILGEYVGRIYEEVKRRPLYIVGDTVNVPPTSDQPRNTPEDLGSG
ncbi:MAG TPA: glycosyltransferase family 2 protein [Polyangiaceae bacterium]|nr:glycosyltransferase family 2 protein [Polyangiaceae bacterium]